jgi:hypothetical protein
MGIAALHPSYGLTALRWPPIRAGDQPKQRADDRSQYTAGPKNTLQGVKVGERELDAGEALIQREWEQHGEYQPHSICNSASQLSHQTGSSSKGTRIGSAGFGHAWATIRRGEPVRRQLSNGFLACGCAEDPVVGQGHEHLRIA